MSAGALAYAISIKLTPAAFLLPFTIEKDWKQIGKVSACFLIFAVTPIFLFGWESIQPYITSIFFEGFGMHGKDVYYNQSLLAFLLRTVSDSSAVLLFKGSWIVFPLLSWFALSKIKEERFAVSIAVATCLYLMLHPLAWQHHFIFAVIPLLVGWKQLPKWIVILSFTLIAANMKQPQLVQGWAKILLSDQFLGIFFLWINFLTLGLVRKVFSSNEKDEISQSFIKSVSRRF